MKYYWFTFEDGYSVCVRGMSEQELRVEECGSKRVLTESCLDLINRQKAEIERYKGVIKILEKDVKDAEGRTVKEFAHYLIDNGEEGKINTFDLLDYVCEFLSKPEKVEHDSLCETETYKTLKERF